MWSQHLLLLRASRREPHGRSGGRWVRASTSLRLPQPSRTPCCIGHSMSRRSEPARRAALKSWSVRCLSPARILERSGRDRRFHISNLSQSIRYSERNRGFRVAPLEKPAAATEPALTPGAQFIGMVFPFEHLQHTGTSDACREAAAESETSSARWGCRLAHGAERTGGGKAGVMARHFDSPLMFVSIRTAPDSVASTPIP